MKKGLFFLLSVFILCGCGQTGHLYLPEQSPNDTNTTGRIQHDASPPVS